jgi:hypothetical protein
MAERPGLSDIELAWFLAWSIADGEWARVGLDQAKGRELLLDLFSQIKKGDRLQAAKESGMRLQQSLMALRRHTFEEIQLESPFSRLAQRNMRNLLRAWTEEGDAGFARAWEQIFQPGWEAAQEAPNPIRIIVDTGESEDRALEVTGAPDTETRVAAEYWYLYYTFGRGWTQTIHYTTRANEHGAHFSVHNIHIFPNSHKQIYFRLPW